MIFQNFGFNRQIIQAAGGSAYNYVSGAKVLYDIGNPDSYPGSGTTVTNLGSAGSSSNGTISASGLYSSSNGGVLNLTHNNRDRITFTTSVTAAFTTQAIARKTSGGTAWGTAASYYQGMPNIRGNNGIIVTGNIDGNTQTLAIIWNGSSANVPAANFVYPANCAIFHSYAYTSNGTNEHKMYLDNDSPATATNSFSRGDSASLTSYINYDQPNNGSEDLVFMAYLQYDRVLSAAEIAQNLAVFSGRF
jgi:hypothetical protein